MATSLLESDSGGIEAGAADASSSRLDRVLSDCLNCAMLRAPHFPGRDSESFGGESTSSGPPRRSRFGRALPSEHMDA